MKLLRNLSLGLALGALTVAGGLLGAATPASAQGAPPGFFQVPGTTTSLLITGQVGTRGIFDTVSAPDYPALYATDADILIPLFIPSNGSNAGAANANNRAGSFHFSTRDFSFGFITDTPTAMGPLGTVMIFGAGSNLDDPGPVNKSFQNVGVVVAFGTLGPWMAGMNGTLLSDDDASPDTMGEPLAIAGQLGGLQPSVRYTWKGPGGFSLAGSLEEPFTGGVSNEPVGNFPNQLLPQSAALSSAVTVPVDGGMWSPANPFSTGTIGSRSTWPDIIAKARLDQPWGHVALAGLVHNLQVDCQVNCNPNPGAGGVAGSQDANFAGGNMPNREAVGYGLNLTGHINTWGKDTLKGGAFVGKGLDHYMGDYGSNTGIQIGSGAPCGGLSAAGPTTHGAVTPITWCPGQAVPTEWGIYAAYQHFWTDSLRSTLGAGYSHVGNNYNYMNNGGVLPGAGQGVVQTGVNQEAHWSVAANLIWSPVPKVDIGVEYIYYHIQFMSAAGQPTGPGGVAPGAPGAGNPNGSDQRVEVESIFHF